MNRAQEMLGFLFFITNTVTSYNQNRKATTQKTLTVVIKFDRNSLVKDCSYHASKF